MVETDSTQGGLGGAGSPGSPGSPGAGGTGGTGGTGGVGLRGAKGAAGDKGESGEDTFMTQSLWLGWKRWTWVRMAFGFMVFMSSFGFYREHQFEAREDREERQEQIDNEFRSCERGNDTREVIRAVLDLTGGATDLTGIKGFETLDPDIQAFLINLRDTTAAQADGEKSFKTEARRILVIRDCDAEFPEASDVD